jgi:uncharacterized membrane protein YphA (DoxX/SURF4 family)
MQRVLLLGLCFHFGFNNDTISELCIFAVTIFLCWSYLAAGIQKLKSEEWHSGKLMADLWKTSFKEHKPLQLKPSTFKCLGFGVILFELSFPLALSGQPLLYFYLLLGFFFHLYLYVKLHYSFFFWTFVGSYPAVYFCTENLNSIIQLITKP